MAGSEQRAVFNTLGYLFDELEEALREHPARHPSLEHSCFLIEEELKELQKELYTKEAYRDMGDIRTEALHVAVCAIRLVVESYLRMEDKDGATL